MMDIRYLLLSWTVMLNVAISANAQSSNEFEGIIKYEHKFSFKTSDVDSLEIMDLFGRSSEFYYKNGSYKWVLNSRVQKIEYFNVKEQTVFFLTANNDTLLRSKQNGHDDSLQIFDHLDKQELVCGQMCDIVETVSFTKGEPDYPIRRTLFYSSIVSLRGDRFHSYRSYASDKVFKKIKCWPLKIQLESTTMPFVYIINAVQIIPKKLMDAEVSMPFNRPMKELF